MTDEEEKGTIDCTLMLPFDQVMEINSPIWRYIQHFPCDEPAHKGVTRDGAAMAILYGVAFAMGIEGFQWNLDDPIKTLGMFKLGYENGIAAKLEQDADQSTKH